MRRILPLLLLFAVCLHTAWGWPSHMASHLPGHTGTPQHGAGCAQTADAGTAPQNEDHSPESAAHAACAWCAAHAQQAQALTSHPPLLRAAQEVAELPPTPFTGATAHPPQHWPFASRDPPALDTL